MPNRGGHEPLRDPSCELPLRQPSRKRRTCPVCGDTLVRERRFPQDHANPSLRMTRRYSCRRATCGWEGLLVMQGELPLDLPPRPPWYAARASLLALLFTALVVALGIALFELHVPRR